MRVGRAGHEAELGRQDGLLAPRPLGRAAGFALRSAASYLKESLFFFSSFWLSHVACRFFIP